VSHLVWVNYFFGSLRYRFSRGNAAAFTVFGTLSVYSQYGAMVPVLALIVTLIGVYIFEKRWGDLKYLTGFLAAAFFFAGLPLLWFFLRTQMSVPLYYHTKTPFVPYRGMFGEVAALASNLGNIMKFLFAAAPQQLSFSTVAFVLHVAIVALVVLNASRRGQSVSKYLCISAVVTFFSYYAATRAGVYSLLHSRYTLPLLPALLTASSVSFRACFLRLRVFVEYKNRTLPYLTAMLLLAPLCYANWTVIESHWQKENVREAVQFLMRDRAIEEPLYIYYGAVPAFAFYANQYALDYGRDAIASWGVAGDLKEGVTPADTRHKNFYYGENSKGKDAEAIAMSIKQSFSGKMPDFFRVLFSHISGYEGRLCLQAFAKCGYKMVQSHTEGEAAVAAFQKSPPPGRGSGAD
jgi:hypothetical protein